MRSQASLEQVSSAFAAWFGGAVKDIHRHGSGHIHDTFVLDWQAGGASTRLLVQRFNTDVFRDPEGVMQNIVRVTDHLRTQLQPRAELARRVLRVRPAPDGALLFRSAQAGSPSPTYRAFDFIADTVAFDVVVSPAQPQQAGQAFGGFSAQLDDLPGPPLLETIPGFHDTAARLRALREAFACDPLGRAQALQAEFSQLQAHAALAEAPGRWAASGEVPLRTVHNDAKLSNLLFDARTGEALCVVDLDTVMPGYLAYDFGDLVRTTACLVAEDARDLTTLEVRMDYIEALARGYLATRDAISQAECESLALGPQLVCYELALRFLTDHVQGDPYFAIARPNQNLERARVQLRLLDELQQRTAALEACVQRARRAG